MKRLIKALSAIVSASAMGVASAVAAAPVQLHINAVAEKHDFNVAFKRGALASIGVDDSIFNGIKGLTTAFDGQELPLYLILQEPMDLDKAAVFAEHQGKLEGMAKCALVQKGNSPDIPAIKLAVLAQNCIITSVTF